LRFSFYIAWRYAFSKSKSKAINIITAIASVGIVVSAMAMFVVLSVFSGLRTFSLSFTNELDPELKVFSEKGKSFEISEEQIKALETSGLFEGIAKVAEDRLLFTFHEKQTVAFVKGVDERYNEVSAFEDKVEYGMWIEPESNDAVVGLGISYLFSMGLFDVDNAFEVVAMKPGKGVINNPEDAFIRKHLTPVGIYILGNEDLDDKYVFTTLELAQELLSLSENEITNLELKLANGVSEKAAIAKIKEVLGESFIVKNRIQLNDGLYRMLNTENAVTYLILLLVVIIALFTLIGALIMIILEKQANIKTLSHLGVNLQRLRKIFLYQGMIVSVLGGLLGVMLGVIVVLLQQHFVFIMIREGFPYPIEFNFMNVILVLVSIFILGFIAAYIASSRVNKSYLQKV
jgi:lipoprotein-releasing system permease protein